LVVGFWLVIRMGPTAKMITRIDGTFWWRLN
jgi:hypothetical protein